MSTKLYPPDIGGIIPAFYGNTVTVPFTMNKLVATEEIGGFSLIFKSIANSKQLATLTTTFSINDITGYEDWRGGNWNRTTNEVNFDIGNNSDFLKVGQYYKVQMRYIHKDKTHGFLSNVATVKYTSAPEVSILGLSTTAATFNPVTFVGQYQNALDPLEKVYSYRFNVKDKDGNIYDTSGECLHNSFQDEANGNGSIDSYILAKDLPMNKEYKIEYIVTTTNQLTISSPAYLIIQKESIDPELRAQVIAELNKDNGYIKVRLKGEATESGIEPAAIGSFRLKRASNKDNYGVWQTVYQFKLNGQLPSQWSWTDKTIEHGYSYRYGLEQYSDTIISNKILSNEIYAEFEDAFLFDGKRQLKIKYNPKVSSFKTTILETKQDTIGSKYPFFFRNGSVAYKEFPISGLISYHSDNEELFISKEELFLEEQTHNLTDNNLAAERIFKMSVLDWLNNGELKIFRSPTEGNFIVRLLNVSLSPVDTVGRMLHNFSATAYEVKDFNYNTIADLGFLALGDIEEKYTTRWETVNLSNNSFEIGTPLALHYPITSFVINDATPGTQFQLKIDGVLSDPIIIGATGMYKIDLGDKLSIDEIIIATLGVHSGSITYSYESSAQNTFDTITDVTINDWLFAQYIGEHSDVIGEIEEKVSYENEDTKVQTTFQGLRKTLSGLKYLRFWKREVYDLYKIENQYYWDAEKTNELLIEDFQPLVVYNVITEVKKYYDTNLLLEHEGKLNEAISEAAEQAQTVYSIDGKKFYGDRHCQGNSLIVDTALLLNKYRDYRNNFKQKYGNMIFKVVFVEYMDGVPNADKNNNLSPKILKSYSNTFIINNESYIDLSETGFFKLPAEYNIKTLELGSGVVFECAYQTKEITYQLEKQSEIATLKNAYKTYTNLFNEYLWGKDLDGNSQVGASDQEEKNWTVKNYYDTMINGRNRFLIALYKALQEQKEVTGYYV